ncbi:MAG TPA: hypothetical protein VE082_07570 [Desulfobaccales bacterium]|nr:hypothetical protein [Desulfobaccales bacterium]
MRRKIVEISHQCLTNNWFILAWAIVLFMLVNALLDPCKVDAVIRPVWI